MQWVVKCDCCNKPIGMAYVQDEWDGNGDYAKMNEDWCGVEGERLCYQCYEGVANE